MRQNRVHLRNVTLGQNLGQIVQVMSGLNPGDRLVNNPPAGLLEGQMVQPVTPMPGYAAATQKAIDATGAGFPRRRLQR